MEISTNKQENGWDRGGRWAQLLPLTRRCQTSAASGRLISGTRSPVPPPSRSPGRCCPPALTRVLREDINPRVGHVDRGRPARRRPGDAAGLPGSSPGAAAPGPLRLVRLGGVRRLRLRLQSGRCALADAAYLLPHPGAVAFRTFGTKRGTPLAHLWLTFPRAEGPGPNSRPQPPPPRSPLPAPRSSSPRWREPACSDSLG